MTTTVTQLMTAEELLQMPRGRSRYELLQGELRVMELAGFEHGKIAMNVSTPLAQYVRTNELGEVCAAETGFN